MSNLSHPSAERAANPTASPTAFAAEWILLNSGCEDVMSYDEWRARKMAAVEYSDNWTEVERTEFFYAVADQACTEPRLTPTPGLVMTPENTARELRRLEHIIWDLYDGQSEHPPSDWMRFTDPLMAGYTVGESWRYSVERTTLAYGLERGPVGLPSNADIKLCDLIRPTGPN